MSLLTPLIGFGLRQVIGDSAEDVIGAVKQRFLDHSRTLPKALENAHRRAWQALGVALAGDGFFDSLKVLFASGDDRGVREQVQTFLTSNAVSFDGTPAAFRQACLDEWKRLRQSGLLSATAGFNKEIAGVAQQAAGFRRHTDPQGLIEESRRAVAGVADALPPDCPNLSRLLRTPTPSGPPLLAAAFCYFFRREVETDDELAHGLFFDGLRQLSASQAKAFGEIGKALDEIGERFDGVFEQLGRIEAAVVETHGAVLDVQAELQRLGGLHLANAGEIRSLLEQVQSQLDGYSYTEPGARLSEQKDSPLLATQASPQRPGTLYTNSVGMKFAWIPPGAFLMGSPAKELKRREDELQHSVVLRRGFWLGVHPVTQDQWRAVVSINPSHFRQVGPLPLYRGLHVGLSAELPVEQIAFDDALGFCEALRAKEGRKYRLPTEAEWEYACRAGTVTPFHLGTTLTTDDGNYNGNYVYADGKRGLYRGRTTPVGSYSPNAWGLFDMHGNVWEWCNDWYGDYPAEDVADPTGPVTGDARLLRGGSWYNHPVDCRSANRHSDLPGRRCNNIGCRVALILD